MQINVKPDSEDEYKIIKATTKPDPKSEDKQALQKLLDEKPEIWQSVTDLVVAVQNNILKSDVFKEYFAQESYRRKIASMRDNLGWQTAGELEKILIEQVCLNWLRLNLMENLHNSKTYEKHNVETGLYWEKRLNSAQRRYLRVCESLAKVRKLLADAELKEQQARNKRGKSALIANQLLKDLSS